MNTKSSTCIVATAFLALAMPLQLLAQQGRDHRGKHYQYKLFDLGTFGGPQSFFSDGNPPLSNIANSRGVGVGAAETTIPDPNAPNCILDCLVAHAFQAKDGNLTDLGALPGVNTSFATAINEHGMSIGMSENGAIDPLTGFPETDAVLWKDHKVVNLGTLGGNSSISYAINEGGQVVGAALNSTPDLFTSVSNYFFVFPIATQARAFVWQNGEMQDLGTLGGPDSVATYINDRGAVAGESFLNSIPNSATGVPTWDPFFWLPCHRDSWDSEECRDDPDGATGKMLDLGGLGGTTGLVAGLNNRDQVIGQSNLAGDATHHPFLWYRGILTDLGTLGGDSGGATWLTPDGQVVGVANLPIACPGCEQPQVYHAFSWKRGVMTDLGTVEGDRCSVGYGANARGEVVGASGICHGALHAFLWERGQMLNLNSLVSPASDLRLAEAIYITEGGEIAGTGVTPNNDVHAFLLIPCDGDHQDVDGCDYEPVDLDALAASAPAKGAPSSSTSNVPKIGSKFAHRVYK